MTENADVSNLAWELPPALEEQASAFIGWGAVAQAIIEFVIVAFALFLVVKAMNRLNRQEAAAPAVPPEDVQLLREIRDALVKRA